MRFDVCLHLYLRGSCQACITNCQLIQATGTVHNWSYTSLFGNSLLYLVSNLGPACLAITCATATVTAIALGLRRKFGSDRGPWPQSTYCLAAQLQMGKGGKAKGKGKADGKGGKGKGTPADPCRSCMTWLEEKKTRKTRVAAVAACRQHLTQLQLQMFSDHVCERFTVSPRAEVK